MVLGYDNWNSCLPERRETGRPQEPKRTGFLGRGQTNGDTICPAAGWGGGVATQLARTCSCLCRFIDKISDWYPGIEVCVSGVVVQLTVPLPSTSLALVLSL